MLKTIQVDVQDSFASIFVQKEIDNAQGFVRIAGGLPSPGYQGTNGLFATVYFQALRPGSTQVHFLPSSMVMSNDDKGTNILKEYLAANYLISATQLTP